MVKQQTCLPANGLLTSIWNLKYNRINNLIIEKQVHTSASGTVNGTVNGGVTELMNSELPLMALDRMSWTNSDDSTLDQTHLRLGCSGV